MRRRGLLAGVAVLGLAWCATDEDKIWSDYVAWYRRQPITVTDTRGAYLEHLRQSGVPHAEARARSAIVERLTKERRDQLHPFFFDRTYSGAAPRFNTSPNALLVAAVRDRTPGRALDIHMGQGRNALLLASKGWAVTGFDFSEEGVRVAQAAAKEAGLPLTALVRHHEDFDFGRSQWDLVLMSYTWVPLAEPYIGRVIDSLRPGGLLVFEHLMDESGSAGAAAWIPRPNQLPEVFGRLRILQYEDVRAQADWSWRPERIARLVAQK